jgi:hypothetical protein
MHVRLGFVATVEVDVFEIEGVHVTGEVSKTVRQMLMRRAAPQPATKKKPMGGTENIMILLRNIWWLESYKVGQGKFIQRAIT